MNKYISIIRCTAAAALLCCAGCTDQWDDHYAEEAGANGSSTLTLWEQIQRTPELQNFATVCEKTTFRTSETNKAEGYTFANMLGKPLADGTVSATTLTVYAPVITDSQRDSILNLINAGNEWEVQTQFLGNHIQRNRRDIVGSGSEKMYMLNSKLYTLNVSDKTLNGVAMKSVNQPATNGVLHVLDGMVAFVPNLHEYLRAIKRENAFADFIVLGDSSYFSPELSIEGEPDENDQITYIDSVFKTTNKYFSRQVLETNRNFNGFRFNGLGEDISDEDSMFAMVIPSSAAFADALARLKKYYRYADYYENNSLRDGIKKKTESGYDAIVRALPSVEDVDNMPTYLETLQTMMTRSQLLRSLLFKMNVQYNAPKGNQEEVINAFDDWKNTIVDSIGFLSTFGDTLRALPYRPYYRVTQRDAESDSVYGINWDELLSQASTTRPFNPRDIFDGKQPVRMSNGLAYVVDNYNIDPLLNVHTDLVVEPENTFNVYQTSIEGSQQSKVVVGTQQKDEVMEQFGRVSNGYLSLGASGTGGVSVTFKMPAVLSAKYDIYVVVVPEFYNSGEDNKFPCTFQATLNYIGEDGLDSNNNAATITSSKITTDPNKVQTYLLFEDFEFPYSYANLNNSYPTLTFTTDKQIGSGKKKASTNNLCIDMIYLKAKE